MSEILFSPEREELYRGLGLGEELEVRTFDEDPILNGGPGVSIRNEKAFLKFFQQREYMGSPSEGYLELANLFAKDLQVLVAHMAPLADEPRMSDQELVLPIILNPLVPSEDDIQWRKNNAKARKLYKTAETPASRAFRGRMEYMMYARLLAAELDADSCGQLLYACRYYSEERQTGIDFFMAESKRQDKKGKYATLEIRNTMPLDMDIARQRFEINERPFLTTAEEQEQWRRSPEGREADRQRKTVVAKWDAAFDAAHSKLGEREHEGLTAEEIEVLRKLKAEKIRAPHVLFSIVEAQIHEDQAPESGEQQAA